MIDLSDQNKDRIYLRAFEHDNGLEQLLDALRMAAPLTPSQSELVYDLYLARVRDVLGTRLDGHQLHTFSKHLQQARHILQGVGDKLADQIAVLEDLIDDTLEALEDFPIERILGRDHVCTALRIIGRHQEITRFGFRSELGTGEANTTRLIKMLAKTGLVERVQLGRNISLRLTNFGRESVARRLNTTTVNEADDGIGPTGRGNMCVQSLRNIVCYHQGAFIQYMFIAAEKHKQLKAELNNGQDARKLADYTKGLMDFLNAHFSHSVYQTFARLKDYFLSTGRSSPRVCLKGNFPTGYDTNIFTIFRDSVTEYNSDTDVRANSGYLHIANTGRYFLQNDIPGAFMRGEYKNPRLNYDKLGAIKGRSDDAAYCRANWDEFWKDYTRDRAGHSSFYASTLIVPLTLWNNDLSDEFKAIITSKNGYVFGDMKSVGRNIFGYLCIDHRQPWVFVEDDISIGYVAADMLSIYAFTRTMYTDISKTFNKVRQILAENNIDVGFEPLPERHKELGIAETEIDHRHFENETYSSDNQLVPTDSVLRKVLETT